MWAASSRQQSSTAGHRRATSSAAHGSKLQSRYAAARWPLSFLRFAPFSTSRTASQAHPARPLGVPLQCSVLCLKSPYIKNVILSDRRERRIYVFHFKMHRSLAPPPQQTKVGFAGAPAALGMTAELLSKLRDRLVGYLDSPLPESSASPFPGRKSGNRITSRMEREPVSSMVMRSMPIPSPAVGGMP